MADGTSADWSHRRTSPVQGFAAEMSEEDARALAGDRRLLGTLTLTSRRARAPRGRPARRGARSS